MKEKKVLLEELKNKKCYLRN